LGQRINTRLRAGGNVSGAVFDFMTGGLDPRISIARASSAWHYNSAGNLVEVGSDVPRFDYDPVTLAARGLLTEGARTNIALHSRDFTQTAWVKTNITAALNVTGITGVTNSASRLTATAGNGTALQTITSASASHVSSFFARRITGTGTVEITQDNGASWTAITLTSAWQRFAIPAATIVNPVIGFRLVTSGDVIAVDVAQCEVGTFATSPIITGAAAITRAAETGTMPFVVPSEFSLLAELVTTERLSGTGAATQQLMAADDGTTNNAFELQQRTTATPTSRLSVVIGGTGTALATSVLTLGAVHKHIGAYSGGNVAYCANGGAVATQSGLTLPALSRIRFAAFGSPASVQTITYLRRIVIYPTSLSSSVLQALTA
jgi:hypothetical protein